MKFNARRSSCRRRLPRSLRLRNSDVEQALLPDSCCELCSILDDDSSYRGRLENTAFAPLSEEAGIYAVAMIDAAYICERDGGVSGSGVRRWFAKRPINFASACIIRGLPFTFRDPGELLGAKEDVEKTSVLTRQSLSV